MDSDGLENVCSEVGGDGAPIISEKPTTKYNCKHFVEQFKGLASVTGRLHLQLVRKAIPEGKTERRSILDKVSVWTDPDVAHRITCSLERRFKATEANVIRFRASIILSLTDDEWTWPIVEWTESDGLEVVAIFYIDEDAPSDVCGWLMHTGKGFIENPEKKSMRWEKTSISWSVGEMDHLQSLFEALLQLSTVIQWPTADMLGLYCETEDSDTLSSEKYISCLIPLMCQVNSLCNSPISLCSGTRTVGEDFRQCGSNVGRAGPDKTFFPFLYRFSHIIAISDNCDYSMFCGSISLEDCLCSEGS